MDDADKKLNDEYHRVLDIKIIDLRADMEKLKASTDSLHAEVRSVMAGVTNMQAWVQDSSEVLRDCRTILGSFSFAGKISKWVTTVAAAVAITYATVKGWTK